MSTRRVTDNQTMSNILSRGYLPCKLGPAENSIKFQQGKNKVKRKRTPLIFDTMVQNSKNSLLKQAQVV